MLKRKLLIVCLSVSLFLNFSSCSILKTFENIGRLKFRLGTIDNLLFSGVSVNSKSRLQDFNAAEVLRLTSAVAQKKLPVSFTLNIQALNPNTGSGGGAATDLTLKSFPWRLYIDDKETISGDISAPIYVPGKGEATVFPLKVNLDLFRFFGDRGFESLVNLGLKLGGMHGSSVNVKLVAKPTISSPIGDITYPKELTIVNQQYN